MAAYDPKTSALLAKCNEIEKIFFECALGGKFQTLEFCIQVELTSKTKEVIATFMIFPQYKLERYTLDFVVLHCDTCNSFDIEIDGHEFHEKTKKQVARDKKRDRTIQKSRVQVIRFSGSEVFKSPASCWKEVIDIILAFGDR